MTQTQRTGVTPTARPFDTDSKATVAPLPDAFHEQTEHEVEVAYADGYQAGYIAALREFAIGWTKATGEQPRTFRGTVRWLIKDFERNGVVV